MVEDGKLESLLEEQIRAQVRQEQMMKRDTDSLNNLTGLNGLATNGTMGLQSVSTFNSWRLAVGMDRAVIGCRRRKLD